MPEWLSEPTYPVLRNLLWLADPDRKSQNVFEAYQSLSLCFETAAGVLKNARCAQDFAYAEYLEALPKNPVGLELEYSAVAFATKAYMAPSSWVVVLSSFFSRDRVPISFGDLYLHQVKPIVFEKLSQHCGFQRFAADTEIGCAAAASLACVAADFKIRGATSYFGWIANSWPQGVCFLHCWLKKHHRNGTHVPRAWVCGSGWPL